LLAQPTWRKSYGGLGSDEGTCVEQTMDGGYIVAGTTGSFGSGSSDMYMLKLDSIGQLEWSNVYGDIGVERGEAVRELGDGYILCGNIQDPIAGDYNISLVRTDLSGTVLWQRQYGTSNWDFASDVASLTDGFILTGLTYGDAMQIGKVYTVRTDLNGDTLWTLISDDPGHSEGLSIKQTDDLGFIICGMIEIASENTDGFLKRLDGFGGEMWTATFGSDSIEYLSEVLETSIGEFVAIGGTNSYSQFTQIYLVSANAGGNFIWDQKIGSGANAGGWAIDYDHAGGYVLTGYNELNAGKRDMIWTIVDPGGWFVSGNNFGDGNPSDGKSIRITADGGYVVAGWIEDVGPGTRSIYVVKTDTAGQTSSTVIDGIADPLNVVSASASKQQIRIQPTLVDRGTPVRIIPNGPTEITEILLFDAQGRLLKTLGTRSLLMESGELKAGRYTLRITTQNQISNLGFVVGE